MLSGGLTELLTTGWHCLVAAPLGDLPGCFNLPLHALGLRPSYLTQTPWPPFSITFCGDTSVVAALFPTSRGD